MAEVENKRIFIGGLSTQVKEADLKGRFLRFGDVTSIELKSKVNPVSGVANVFAYVDLKITGPNLTKCESHQFISL
jgi:RNA recognition motif-containing protein